MSILPLSSSLSDGKNLSEDRLRVRTRLGVNMVVEAGAGTGKTTLLIERLCFALLAQGITAPRLVALTFTEKAAAEIKTRLMFKLQSVLRIAREGGTDTTLETLREHFSVPLAAITARAETALSQLDRSQIGTIHGFCSDILRAYPLEAGLTPNAEIDKGPRAQYIFDAQWNKFLDSELGEKAPRAALWKEILSRVTLAELRDCALEMCSGKIKIYNYFAQRNLLARVCHERAQTAERLSKAFLGEKKKPRVIEQALQQAHRRFMQAGVWLETGQLPEKAEETIVIKSIPKEWDEQNEEEAKSLCRFAAQADPFVQTWVLKVYALLEEINRSVRARYVAEGILSFDDLIVKTRDLLQSNLLVRRLLQEKYDVLYVDEFQDTDPVQGEILLFLAEQKGCGASSWREVKLEPGKLFVVGDPKQSIYRFRGADITAYQLFTDLILRQGGEKAYLRQNLRSEREIIALANGVCSVVMTEKPAFQPAYEPIFTAKQELTGAAELALICGEEQKISADDYRHNQAELVASWIAKNVGKMTLRSGRKLEYKDIAILSRAATTLGPYTGALRRHAIPFSIEEDKDFYRRQEVSDFLNFLRAIDDPLDTVALVGVMRSPLGGLTDAELYYASQQGKLDFRLPSAEPKLERLFVTLRAFAARAGREPLRKLLRGVINETFLAESCAAAYDGERSIANLERLVSLAEGYSLQTPATLGQFLSRVQEIMAQEQGRLTALAEGESFGAVSVMTVHKSKGLEFPVVIWVDVSKQDTAGSAKRPPHLYSWRYDLHGLRVGKYADINLAWLEEEQKEHARCEEVRVLYVALTRAQEKLLIVGNEKSESYTSAEQFARAGLFPPTGQRPKHLGKEDELSVTYMPYALPSDFIYKHQAMAGTERISMDLPSWRKIYDTRLCEYEMLKNARGPLAPSAHIGTEKTDEQAVSLGILVHRVLTQMWNREEINLDECLSADTLSDEQQIAEAKEFLVQFMHSSVYKRLRSMQMLGTEMPFSLKISVGVVNGVIDLLLRADESTVWVIDFKTDRVKAGEEQKAAEKYRAQLDIYAQAVRALYPGQSVRCAVVFVRTAVMVETEPDSTGV